MIARLALFAAVTVTLRAADPSYFRDIRPILQRQCQGCHQPNLKSSGLDLTTYDGQQVPALFAYPSNSLACLMYQGGIGQPKEAAFLPNGLAAGAAKRPSDLGPLQIMAGGTVALGNGPEVREAREATRGTIGFYVGGMGAREKNFYNELCAAYGYVEVMAERVRAGGNRPREVEPALIYKPVGR